MLTGFKSYHLATELYQQCLAVKGKAYVVDQLQRASFSVVLNPAEGSAKESAKERRRFYGIALASLREVQAVLTITDQRRLHPKSDILGTMLYKLVKNT